MPASYTEMVHKNSILHTFVYTHINAGMHIYIYVYVHIYGYKQKRILRVTKYYLRFPINGNAVC